MSTKIYNGYKVELGKDGVFGFVEKLRSEIGVVYIEEYRATMVALACSLYDARDLGYEIDVFGEYGTDMSKGAPLRLAGVLMDTEKTKIETGVRRGNATFDLSFKVVFYRDGASTLAVTFGELGEYTRVFEAMEEVSEYGYWNNTDPLDTVTDKEWAERGNAWGRALRYMTPGRGVLSWDLLEPGGHSESLWYLREPENVSRYVPYITSRAELAATHLVAKEMAAGSEVKGEEILEVRAAEASEWAEREALIKAKARELARELRPISIKELG